MLPYFTTALATVWKRKEKELSYDTDWPKAKLPLTAENSRPTAHTRRHLGVSWLHTPLPVSGSGPHPSESSPEWESNVMVVMVLQLL